MLEQSSNLYEEETEMGHLTSAETARLIVYLRAVGLTDKQINDCQIYVATGVGLPSEETEEKADK